ncbi:dihydropteroate synthase [Bacteroidia bacterium]|nr:dihydropteroate synthase [Bacteroidia bacterium]
MVMGILNCTTDSFYDGGRYLSEKEIIKRINTIVEEGAGIIDVGAYSTKPGAREVGEKEELMRLDFALELIRKYHPHIPISVDTFRAEVAKELTKCFGDLIINDISGGTLDAGMFDFIAASGLPYILMHIQGTPQNMQDKPVYQDVTREVKEFFEVRIKQLNDKGVDNIILDPGFGFGKTVAHNYELLQHTDIFSAMGYPMLIGISRKSMIYKLLNQTPETALNGTTVLNTIALLKGAKILRVHDVKEAVEAIRIVEMYQKTV